MYVYQGQRMKSEVVKVERVGLTSSFRHAISIGRFVDELEETDARSGDSSMSGVTVCHFWAASGVER